MKWVLITILASAALLLTVRIIIYAIVCIKIKIEEKRSRQ